MDRLPDELWRVIEDFCDIDTRRAWGRPPRRLNVTLPFHPRYLDSTSSSVWVRLESPLGCYMICTCAQGRYVLRTTHAIPLAQGTGLGVSFLGAWLEYPDGSWSCVIDPEENGWAMWD